MSSPATTSPLSICLELAHAISATSRLDDIYDAALHALTTGLDLHRAALLFFDPDGVMRFAAWRGVSDAYRHAVEGHTPWPHGARNAQAIVTRDVMQDARLAPWLPAIQAEHIAALACIPLEGTAGVIGACELYGDQPRDFPLEDVQLARLVAAQVTFAVERTTADLVARRSNEHLGFALDAANMGTWDWDLESGSVRWSDNMERIHGLSPSAFGGTFQNYEREIHPEDWGRVAASIERALSQGVPHDVEYRIVAPDGTVRWVEGKGRVEYGPDGRPRRMTGVCMNITTRKEAELGRMDALAESNRASQRLAAIVESSDAAIVSKDLDGMVISWNDGAERMFGYTARDVIGRAITFIVPPDRLAEEDMVLATVRAGRPVEMETIRRHENGTDIAISLVVSPVRDVDGRIVGASTIARDITARKRDEAERVELHRRLTVLVTASSSLLASPEPASVRSATVSLARRLLAADGYAIWASDFPHSPWRVIAAEGISTTFTNRRIPKNRGAMPQADTLRSEPVAVQDVDVQPMDNDQRAAYREEGIRSMLVCPMRFRDEREGTLVFYYRTPHHFTDADTQSGQALTNLAAAALTTADLYEEQRTQRLAADAARRHAALLADATAILSQSLDYEKTLAAVAQLAVPEIADWCAVDILDERGRLQRLAVAHVDPAKMVCAQALAERYPSDPVAKGGLYDVIRMGMPTMMAAIPPDIIVASARDEEHLRLLKELSLASFMCVPLVSTNRTFGAMTFFFTESGRHYSERDLTLARDLATRAALAIENARAYRHAHDANRLKDDFLATLSHELRTPLNAVLGYAQMLDAGVLTLDRQKNAMTVLMRNAEALGQIIDDVLDVSRITSGRLRLNVQRLELAEILKNAVATVQPAADAKGVTLELTLPDGDTSMSGDPNRLQQVVWNLLSNALKFTQRGGHAQLRLERLSASIDIIVSDDGQGIDAAFLPHIFERFRQADSRFSREHGGLGLGLAIARDLVELHGGTISASSDGPGTGATFIISLPSVA